MQVNKKLIYKEGYLLATISTDVTLSTNYVLTLDTVANYYGSKLNLSSGKILIGNGVKKIRVSGGVFGQNLTTGSYLWAYVRKNGTNQAGYINSAAGTYCSAGISSSIINVTSGDLIDLMADSPSGGTARSGKANTWVLVEIIE